MCQLAALAFGVAVIVSTPANETVVNEVAMILVNNFFKVNASQLKYIFEISGESLITKVLSECSTTNGVVKMNDTMTYFVKRKVTLRSKVEIEGTRILV